MIQQITLWISGSVDITENTLQNVEKNEPFEQLRFLY